MNGADGFHVSSGDGSLTVRVVGQGNMRNAPVLDALMRVEFEQGIRRVVVDLSACTGLDSTFMGFLVGLQYRAASLVGGGVTVVNPSSLALRLLDMLGVSSVVPLMTGVDLPSTQEVHLAAGAPTAPRMDLVREAHQHLMQVSEANRLKFAAFMTALEADLAKKAEKNDLPPGGK